MAEERRIIYVDAGGKKNKGYKIGLYDKNSNATHIMDLVDVSNNNLAEKYAVFYAILYIQKHSYKNCMILSDNESAVVDKVLINLLQELKISISWIPREINNIADKTTKREATLKEIDWNLLKLFVNLSNKAYSDIDNSSKDDIELRQQLKEKNIKIKNQSNEITRLKEKNKSKNNKD